MCRSTQFFWNVTLSMSRASKTFSAWRKAPKVINKFSNSFYMITGMKVSLSSLCRLDAVMSVAISSIQLVFAKGTHGRIASQYMLEQIVFVTTNSAFIIYSKKKQSTNQSVASQNLWTWLSSLLPAAIPIQYILWFGIFQQEGRVCAPNFNYELSIQQDVWTLK